MPDDFDWLDAAFDDLPLEHNLTPSVGALVNLWQKRLTLQADLFQVKQLGSGTLSDYENQTVLALNARLTPFPVWPSLNVSAGYQETFGLKNIDIKSYMLDVNYGW